MSFPAASLIISNAVPREKQGVGMSLVNTVVNYSISIALGIAGTVEMQVTKGDAGPGAALRGYRSAWYFGIGLAGLGLCFSMVNLVITKIKSRSKLQIGEIDGGFGREAVESGSDPEGRCGVDNV